MKVYGGGNAEFWKRYLSDTGYRRYGFTQEHQLRNPIWQNEGHIKTLRRLLEVITTSESDCKEHLGNVYLNMERRDEAVASGKYPRCGGNLVLRKGKYGQSYGCSNYPRCNYILNK